MQVDNRTMPTNTANEAQPMPKSSDVLVRRTVYNDSKGVYEEELVPLTKWEAEDRLLQREMWRESMARADKFQQSVTDLFESTLRSAKGTYKLLTAMSSALFTTGLALFVFAALYASLADAKVYSLVFAGLGASTFVTLFIYRPYEDAQNALSNMIQSEMAFMAFFEPVNQATQRNSWPLPSVEVALIADFEAVLVTSLAIPAMPCARTTQITDAAALQPG